MSDVSIKWIKQQKGRTKNTALIVREYDKKTRISRVYHLFFDGPLGAKRFAAELAKRENLEHDFCVGTVNYTSEPLDISKIEREMREAARR
jgi:hypothetical protein